MPEVNGPPPLDWGVGHYESTAAQLAPAAEVVIQRAGLRAGQRVLDLGCGTGNAALVAARTGAEVIGVDPATRLLEVARARADADGLSVTFELGNAGAIPLPDHSVDVIVSVFAVIFAPDPVAAAAEMARVLIPTGRVVLSAWRPGGPIADMNRVASETMMTALGAPPPPPGGFAWHERESLIEAFGPHGFSVEIDEHRLAYVANSVDEFVDTEQQNHPMAVTGKAVLEQFGKYDETVRDEMLKRMKAVLEAANEDPPRLRVSSPYVVATLQRS